MKKVLLIIAVVVAVVAAIEYSVPAYEIKIDKQTKKEDLKKLLSEAKENRMNIEITSVNYSEEGFVTTIEGNVLVSRFVNGSFSTSENFSSLTIHRGRGRFFPLFLVSIVNQ
ncbi:MAG: hypothetical protein ACLGGV_09770 [Bacteroidia bacterium]